MKILKRVWPYAAVSFFPFALLVALVAMLGWIIVVMSVGAVVAYLLAYVALVELADRHGF